MNDLTEADYDTLLVHLGPQLAACITNAPEGEAEKTAIDALANTWQPEMTALRSVSFWLTLSVG